MDGPFVLKKKGDRVTMRQNDQSISRPDRVMFRPARWKMSIKALAPRNRVVTPRSKAGPVEPGGRHYHAREEGAQAVARLSKPCSLLCFVRLFPVDSSEFVDLRRCDRKLA